MDIIKEIKENWILVFYLIALFIFNSLNIGPTTIRVYATVMVLVYLIINNKKLINSPNLVVVERSYMKLYYWLLFVMSICLILNGEFIQYDFPKKLLAYHLPCVIVFYLIVYKVNTKVQLEIIMYVMSIIIIIDSVFTILQVSGNPLVWTVSNFLSPVEEQKDFLLDHADFLGYAVFPGLFGDVVQNAFYLSSFLPLAFIGFNHKNIAVKLFSLISIVLIFIAIFITQQRAAFYLSIAAMGGYLCMHLFKRPVYMILFLLSLLLFGTNLSSSVMDMDFGRLLNTDDQIRNDLHASAYSFIADNWLLGGPLAFASKTGLSAHNIFLDGLINSGVIGGVIILVFVVKSFFAIIRRLWSSFVEHFDTHATILALAYCVCILYGFMHNTSILTGNVCNIVLLALFLKSIEFEKQNDDRI